VEAIVEMYFLFDDYVCPGVLEEYGTEFVPPGQEGRRAKKFKASACQEDSIVLPSGMSTELK
jgi:hypothetical protein